MLTYPPFRGEGHGSAVVQTATQLISLSDADLALLFCGEERERFYTRFGWDTLERGRVLVGGREPSALVMVLAVSHASDEIVRSFVNEPLRLDSGW